MLKLFHFLMKVPEFPGVSKVAVVLAEDSIGADRKGLIDFIFPGIGFTSFKFIQKKTQYLLLIFRYFFFLHPDTSASHSNTWVYHPDSTRLTAE